MRLRNLALASLAWLIPPLALATTAPGPNGDSGAAQHGAAVLRARGPLHGGGAAAAVKTQAQQTSGDTKYFHEPGADEELGHYDARYFKGKVAYEDHGDALRQLIRSYLTILAGYGVETWLAHGTLLGWWWNGHIMPWDYDLDVQVSSPTLHWLGRNLNQTEHAYGYVDAVTGAAVNKTYLLDVNPHHAELQHGDGQNVIDARWIDTDNGMFIDITALAERNPRVSPGIWSCKNYHRYRTVDLYPMRRTEFEGVPALVPYSFERVLTEEYGMKSLIVTSWLGHTWHPEIKEWVKDAAPAQRAGNPPKIYTGFAPSSP